ncbi:MAG: YraN family protein [Acidimicrobiia bacterium]
MGHVPAGPLRQERQSDDVPRRQHRGAGALLGSLDTPDSRRKALGAFGEYIAARFLAARGARIVERNKRVGRGELDLIVAIDGVRVAVEVKTGTGDVDPVHHLDEGKLAQVRSLAAQCGVHRVDYVGVAVSRRGVLVRWLPAFD